MYVLYINSVDRKRGDGIGYPGTDWFKLWNKQTIWWKWCVHYYPFSMHKTEELAEGKLYMFATHPHGIFGLTTQGCMGTFGAGVADLFPFSIASRIRLIGLDVMFRIPFFREWLMVWGCASSNKNSFERIFSRGDHVCVNLGGAAESLSVLKDNQENGVMKLILKDRKGFVKLALQHGATIVPCIAFNENLVYHVIETGMLKAIQVFLQKRMKFAIPLFAGHAMLVPTMPRRQPLCMYVGGGLDCPKVANPTQEDIDNKHTEYCRKLEQLFHDYKAHAGHPNWRLELIEDPGKGHKALGQKSLRTAGKKSN